jgi:lysophospholipase L1-like esterase
MHPVRASSAISRPAPRLWDTAARVGKLPGIALLVSIALLATSCASDEASPFVDAQGDTGGSDAGALGANPFADAQGTLPDPPDTGSGTQSPDAVGSSPDGEGGVADVDSADVLAADTSNIEDVDAPSDAPTPQDGGEIPDSTVADAGADDVSDEPSEDGAGADAGGELGIGALCFAEVYDPAVPGPDYDQFDPKAGTHCFGTNHQDITDIESVVFLGDSITVGTPNLENLVPTETGHLYRNKLAVWLLGLFDLDDGGFLSFSQWKAYDLVSGFGGKTASGDLLNCSKFGARTDDLLAGGGQIGKCFPDGGSAKRTLVVFTMGGNDIFKITEVGANASAEEVAAGYPAAWALAQSTVDYLVEALWWLKDPERFPNGAFVVFANPYEFTDGSSKVTACPAAPLAGIKEWQNPAVLEDIVIWINEQYMKAAVETNSDMIWMLEHFCGHGYVATGPNADVNNRCYRGPDAKLYFDETCIHPSEAGHDAIFEMFKATIFE